MCYNQADHVGQIISFLRLVCIKLQLKILNLCNAKEKIDENAVYACALLSVHTDTHGTKGKRGMISWMSDPANV